MRPRAMGEAIRAILLVAVGLLALGVGPVQHDRAAAAAQLSQNNCMVDVCGGNPSCTANDVRVTSLLTWDVVEYCTFVGDTGTYYFRAEFVAGAGSRYDPGVWIATDGGNARTGSCFKDYLTPPLTTTPNYTQPFYGPYWDAEDQPGSGDECGDIEQNISNYKIVGPVTFLCKDADNNGVIDPVGVAVGWDNSSNIN